MAVTAIKEDVDVLGMSFSTGAYDAHVPEVMRLLKENLFFCFQQGLAYHLVLLPGG